MSSNIVDWLQGNREKLKLLVYFGLIVVLAVPVTGMIGRGWQNAKLVESLVRMGQYVGMDLARFSLVALGLYMAFLTLMTIDQKKRVQAVLLWTATLLTLFGLAAMSVFLPNVSPIQNSPWLLGGFVIGVALGGGEQLTDIADGHAIEFRRASRGVYYMIAAATVVMFLELHLEYPNFLVASGGPQFYLRINATGIVPDALTSGVFLFVINQFIKYDADHDFFILGPRESGKSLFLIGAYLEAMERLPENQASTPLNPSPDLISYIEQLERRDAEWIVEATGRGEINVLSFQYVYGSVFPTNVQLSGIDYAGEYLERLPDAITGAMDENDMDTTMTRLTEGIEDADTLLLLVDVERFINNEPLEVRDYFAILNATEDKEALLIATKADHLAEQFSEDRGLQPHRYFDEFKQYTQDRLQENENIRGLTAQVGNTEIHPVYYQTKEDENGNRVPMRDEHGSVVTVGFDELLDKLGRK
jgi:hypothetical protein